MSQPDSESAPWSVESERLLNELVVRPADGLSAADVLHSCLEPAECQPGLQFDDDRHTFEHARSDEQDRHDVHDHGY